MEGDRLGRIQPCLQLAVLDDEIMHAIGPGNRDGSCVDAAPKAHAAHAQRGDGGIRSLQLIAGGGHLWRGRRNLEAVLVEDVLTVEQLDVLKAMRDRPNLPASGLDLALLDFPGQRIPQGREEVLVIIACSGEFWIVQIPIERLKQLARRQIPSGLNPRAHDVPAW